MAETVAIIPARGGSERIPRKNLIPVAGLPLVAHSVRQATSSPAVDRTIVSTDDAQIAAVAESHGAEVVLRPAELSGPTASSESALLHALDEIGSKPELVVFLQPTSPVRGGTDIEDAVEALRAAGADSLFSATPNHLLIWEHRGDGPTPLNYDFRERRREQEMPPQWRENGSIYVVKGELLRREQNRLGGRIAIFEMDYWSSFQVDHEEDVELIEWILSRPRYRPEPDLPDGIELVVLDFDGVMTDNRVLVSSSGEEAVVCHRGDGWGIGALQAAGVEVLVLSTEADPVVSVRCGKLGIACHQDLDDKAGHLRRLLDERGIDPSSVAFVGNDANDIDCMDLVGLPVAVADAEPIARVRAKLVLSRNGGHGAVRELCERLLEQLGVAMPSRRA